MLKTTNSGPPKHVIVFHCEFSSERAPAMLRFLRKHDRAKNAYPSLDFPELYLLKDGYKNFFALQKEATTGSYLPMLDEKHQNDLRHFRKKCKTAPSNKIWAIKVTICFYFVILTSSFQILLRVFNFSIFNYTNINRTKRWKIQLQLYLSNECSIFETIKNCVVFYSVCLKSRVIIKMFNFNFVILL